jgi:hypothetical protein
MSREGEAAEEPSGGPRPNNSVSMYDLARSITEEINAGNVTMHVRIAGLHRPFAVKISEVDLNIGSSPAEMILLGDLIVDNNTPGHPRDVLADIGRDATVIEAVKALEIAMSRSVINSIVDWQRIVERESDHDNGDGDV